jgi:hypothetical protein
VSHEADYEKIKFRCGCSKEREPQIKMSKHDAEREHGSEIVHETGGENMSVAFAIADNPHLLCRDQGAFRQSHKLGDERADPFVRIDDFDHHRQVL